jgi:sigma-E factor negative regulatory protein RseA
MDKMNTQELVSALADGELRGDELARGIAAAAAEPAAAGTWHTYHVIGDVLRSGDLAQAAPCDRFMLKLQASLQAESAPQPVLRPIAVRSAADAVDIAQPAANDSQRWKLVAGFASLAAVAAIGWSVVGVTGEKPGAPQLAAVPAPPAVVPVAVESGRMIRDEQLDKLLAAHRQWGGATALQTPSGFLRNATFVEGASR